MGWEALCHWGKHARRIAPLTGGAANDVWLVEVGGRKAVARLGQRSDADLAWETQLTTALHGKGITVPRAIPTKTGALFAGGITVMEYLEGEPPSSKADWQRVADTLRHLHALTSGWPQRPGWASSTDLLQASSGTKIDLAAMPPDGVARCRAAWARLVGRQRSVVHGNPANPSNVLITKDRVALIDWDEAHVDVSLLDLALPDNAAELDPQTYDAAQQASAAWEAAVCWKDEHAVRCLAQVREV